ncbi:MAG: hypothetical protein AAF226_07470, partial [Verrucomicrobiota bacterium]
MAKHETSTPANTKKRSRRIKRLGIWLLKFAGWSVMMLVVCAAFLCFFAYLAYKNQGAVTNRALGQLVEPYEITVE